MTARPLGADPEVNGLTTVFSGIAERDGNSLTRGKDTPIVFLTALANNEDTGGRVMVAGPTVYLSKLVNTEELMKCIEQTLSPTAQPRFHTHSRFIHEVSLK